jgi:acetyl esterase
LPLDPQCQELLTALEAMELPAFADMTPEECRQTVLGFTMLMGEPEDVAKVEDREIPAPDGPVPVRIFTPAGAGPGPLPVLVYFHGGGFVFGNCELIDPITRTLANKSGCVVVSVDYRLSPEHRFPAAIEDAYAVARWVVDHASDIGGDPARVAVAGDSAGGNLSTVVCLMAKDRGGPPIAFQVLIYPVVDSSMEQPSYAENAEGPILTVRDIQYFWDHYLPSEGDRTQTYASPLRAEDLSGLPPAMVITAEFDPLRDEGEEYGQRLAQAGVPTEVRRYHGMFHGFFWMPAAIDRGRDCMDDIAETLRKALSA